MCIPHGRSLNVNTEDPNGGSEMSRPTERCLGATMKSKVTHRLVFTYLLRVLRVSVFCADYMLRLHAMHRTINERNASSMSGTHGPRHLWQSNKETHRKHNSTREARPETDANHTGCTSSTTPPRNMGVHVDASHNHRLKKNGGGGMCPRRSLRGQKTTRLVSLLDHRPRLPIFRLTYGNRTRYQ